ncbi:DHHA1 domain-containing protein [Mycoplasma sp. CSL7475-4]|uniref:DHH family phosphoesterase n=1 Tax=Mycoplasma sp. CSL7475-4 TaxID=2973942 RepID=UPI00216B25AE|nr:DHHA1 domain-containing protein [Mycoplasma sp. CSL7475-4]MCS4536530.1 DHHA1 domain-containing protein [Mycoplasma sp. CSL7475-4]
MNNLTEQFKKFWEYISKAKFITLLTHKNPDGDTIGASVALKEIIDINSPNTEEVRISGGDCPRNLEFLFDDKLDLVDQSFFDKSLKIVVDTSNKKRVFDQRVIPSQSLKFDHHPVEEEFMFGIGGDYWPATGQLLTQMVMALGLKINQKAMQGLAVAIITDTNNFTQRNITNTTFDTMSFLLKNGLDYKEVLQKIRLNTDEKQAIFNTLKTMKIDGLVSYVISQDVISNDIVRPLVNSFLDISNTEVSLVILKDKYNNYRCSIRSNSYFDVSKIANLYGGGGHYHSSGFNIDSLDKVTEIIATINKK